MVSKFLIKKTGSAISVNEQLDEELYKTMIKNFERRKNYARFKDKIWAADLAKMESFCSNMKNVKYSLYSRCFR